MKRILLQWWYGVKFEPGYTYRKIKSFPISVFDSESSFKTFEKIIDYWISEGWEQYGDIRPGWSRLYLWVRKKTLIVNS